MKKIIKYVFKKTKTFDAQIPKCFGYKMKGKELTAGGKHHSSCLCIHAPSFFMLSYVDGRKETLSSVNVILKEEEKKKSPTAFSQCRLVFFLFSSRLPLSPATGSTQSEKLDD